MIRMIVFCLYLLNIKKETMNKKLTLSLDDQVIKKAKRYAKVHNISISQMVETYLGEVVDQNQPKLTGVVAELAGIIPDSNFDKADYLESKYS